MTTSIPYDPSLALGNIVNPDKLDNLLELSGLQGPIDSAQDALNDLLLLKRSLQMTVVELNDLQIDTTDMQKQMDQVDQDIVKAATSYAQTSVKNLPLITQARSKLTQVASEVESPIDYVRSQLKELPLSSDSLHMDVQYFSFDLQTQKSQDAMTSIKAFISGATSFMGNKRSIEISTAATAQVSKQVELHDIQGVLVITATAHHQGAKVWAPFYIDVDKGIRAWNELYKNDHIDMDDTASIIAIEKEDQQGTPKAFNILSGATYGSSFVGLVHVLKSSETTSSQSMFSAAAALQAQMDVGGWFASASGGFGVDSSFSNSVKSLLSQQNIQSHVSLVTMGIIPTIVANTVDIVVKEFSDFSPDKTMGQLAALQNVTAADQSSVSDAAHQARTGQQLVALHTSALSAAVSAVAKGDAEQNQILDINSLMTAFTDFVTKAIAGNCGVPINYYLKPITKKQLAQMWIAKYLPAQYVNSAGDDATPTPPPQPQPQPSGN
jgi:hypothetical protein